ncbi:MAG: diguanylate cyclase [Magnetococcales bacterium]|nr:diguanylate cyclase [Magnetococcales bacterium]
MQNTNVNQVENIYEHPIKPIETRIAISALLETSLEPLPLQKQLTHALDIILSISWLSVEYKGSIYLLNEESGKLELTAQRFLNKNMLAKCAVLDIGECLCGMAAQTREIVFKSCIDNDHTIHFDGINEHGHFCIPLLRRDRLLGVLNLYVPHNHQRTLEEDAVLSTIGNTLASIIESRYVENALEKERHFIATVLDTTSALVAVLSLDGRIEQINRAYEQLSGYPIAAAVGQMLWDPVVTIEEDAKCMKDHILNTVSNQNPNVCESQCKTVDGKIRIISWANTALVDINGKIKNIIATGIDVTRHREAEKKLEQLAHYDSLTKLPNRYLFTELLCQTILRTRRNKGRLAVLFMDLDRFKDVNDRLGHDIGDLLLVEVAKRIRNLLRINDIVARLGGDEFTIILSDDGPTVENIKLVGHKIIHALQQPFNIQQHICKIGSSIGISRYPEDGNSSEILIKKADIAMYAVKNSGRNQFLLYSPSMGTEV